MIVAIVNILAVIETIDDNEEIKRCGIRFAAKDRLSRATKLG